MSFEPVLTAAEKKVVTNWKGDTPRQILCLVRNVTISGLEVDRQTRSTVMRFSGGTGGWVDENVGKFVQVDEIEEMQHDMWHPHMEQGLWDEMVERLTVWYAQNVRLHYIHLEGSVAFLHDNQKMIPLPVDGL